MKYNISDITYRLDFIPTATEQQRDAAVAACRRNAADDDELAMFTSMLFGEAS